MYGREDESRGRHGVSGAYVGAGRAGLLSPHDSPKMLPSSFVAPSLARLLLAAPVTSAGFSFLNAEANEISTLSMKNTYQLSQ